MEEKLKIAVFIDFDNIEIGVKSTLQREFDVAAVLEALKERGEIVTKIAYANWGRQETSTRQLAEHLERWRRDGRDVAFVIGGADGLAPEIKGCADLLWSLSPLTLPHGLVRVVLAEQLYRAASLLANHPYHRE